MRYLHFIFYIVLFFCFSVKAEERGFERVRVVEQVVERIVEQVYERVYIHTDKECYIAGEDLWLKFYVVDDTFQPSLLSKVGYVEISDTKKPHLQLKVALENGRGAGKVRIPMDISSGIYQLSGYTRYMRNEGQEAFFTKTIAIVNARQRITNPERFEPVEKYEQLQTFEKSEYNNREVVGLLLKTDRERYGNRSKVALSIANIPENTTDLVVSVSRNDSIVILPEPNRAEWKKSVTKTFKVSGQWLPEYEGHIVTGRFIPEAKEQLLANLAFLGKDVRYLNGQVDNQNKTISFYTAGVSGKQQIVTTAIAPSHDKLPYRIDLLTPFEESLPGKLPVLQIYPNEKPLLERYIGAQIQAKTVNDSLDNSGSSAGYPPFHTTTSYDLDEYTRFNTVSETILEFIKNIYVSKVKGKQVIGTYSKFGLKTLVLIDGIPVYEHEDILQYNPANIKKINIYDGCYSFGNESFEYLVSFITHKNNLSFFQLGKESQLLNYDFPQLPSSPEIPDYSNERIRNSQKPDFRHTLYWNPFVEQIKGQTVNLTLFTSDLCGEFKVKVEGITSDGEMIYGEYSFMVTGDK